MILHYLHMTEKSFTEGLSARMFEHGAYALILCEVHFNATNYGPLRGNGADYEDVGRENVVGEGGTGPGGSVESDGCIRRIYGGGRDGGRSRGGSGKVNHRIN